MARKRSKCSRKPSGVTKRVRNYLQMPLFGTVVEQEYKNLQNMGCAASDVNGGFLRIISSLKDWMLSFCGQSTEE